MKRRYRVVTDRYASFPLGTVVFEVGRSGYGHISALPLYERTYSGPPLPFLSCDLEPLDRAPRTTEEMPIVILP